MKHRNRLLIGSVVLCLAILLLAGCGVPQSEYEALQADHAALIQQNSNLKAELEKARADLAKLQADYDTLKLTNDKLTADYETVNNELAEIKEVYPPKDFAAYSVLDRWVQDHIKPSQPTADKLYEQALTVQYQAAKDGYLVSACISGTDEGTGIIFNTAVAGNRLWFWFAEEGIIYEYPIIL